MGGIIGPDDSAARQVELNYAPARGIAIPPPALSAEHLNQLATARMQGRKIRGAVRVATFDCWATAVFAALTLLCSYTSPSGILLALGMGAIAWREFKGGKALARLDPQAPRQLANNQLFLGGLLIVYACWSLYQELHNPGDLSQLIASSPESADMLGSVQDMVHLIMWWVYIGMIACAFAVQGGTAMYYNMRGKLLKKYLENTPAWISDLQRQGLEV